MMVEPSTIRSYAIKTDFVKGIEQDNRCDHCRKTRYTKERCWKLQGWCWKINPDKWKQHSHAQKQMREEKGRPFCNFNISKDSLRSLKIIRHTFEILTFGTQINLFLVITWRYSYTSCCSFSFPSVCRD